MNTYSIALFLHIIGALGFFVALGLEWAGLRKIRNATASEQVRTLMRNYYSTRKLGIASMLTILITGFYMMATAWGSIAWIIVTLGAIVLLIVLTMALTGPRMSAIRRALATEKGPVSQNLHALANRPLLWISIQTRVAIALGIVFLMTIKPDLGGSLLTIGVAIVLGLALSLSMPRRERVQERPAK